MPIVGGRPGAKTARSASASRSMAVDEAMVGQFPIVAASTPLLTLPGVFRPRSDSQLLAHEVAADPATLGGRVVDVCTGSGIVALAAADAGAAETWAVDVSRRAVLTVGMNARRRGLDVHPVRGDLLAAVEGTFDVIASNPPYVPCEDEALPRFGARRAWDAGRDGRVLLDRLLVEGPRRLRDGGAILVTHSDLISEDRTCQLLEDAGLVVDVPVRERGPLGPLMLERREQGLLDGWPEEEEVLVVRGRRA
jgi:release factor glutamine methyltransferase